MQNPTNWLIAFAIVLIIAISGYFIVKSTNAPEAQVTKTTQPKK